MDEELSKNFLKKFTKHLIYAAEEKICEISSEQKMRHLIIRKVPRTPEAHLAKQKPFLPEPTLKEVEKKLREEFPAAVPAEVTFTEKAPGKTEGISLKMPIEERIPEITKPASVGPVVALPDFGKINRLMNDSSVKIIECPGPDKELKVKVAGIVEGTGISLNSGEILDILNKFPRPEGTPLTQMFKSKLGNLSITAFISSTIGAKFMVLKE